MKRDDIPLLRESLPYINKFSGKVMVVKIGGEIADNEDNLKNFCEQVALCVRVGIKMVLVHGGGKQATALSKKLGIEPKIVDGRRITDEKTLEVTKMVFAGQINTDIVTILRKCGLRVVGLSGIDGNLISAKKRPPVHVDGSKKPIDFGLVGDIVGVDVNVINVLINGGFTPAISSLASDDDGEVYNINADTVASAIACALKAEKLILVSNVHGVLDREKNIISKLTRSLAEELIEEKVIAGGMLPKVQSAFKAIENGVRSVHLINGLSSDTLLMELFTESGCGTMIE
ncbi:MAG: acetylglutamate kinase [Planctomycetes bacterium]|nr:acetylglutamate kinase [Planctomycetota bacterium]